MEQIIKKYDAKLDNKKRLTIRGAKFSFYHVEEFENGAIVLRPRVLVDPDELSKNTLSMMDKSIENLNLGKASDPIDLHKYLSFSEDSDEV